MNTYILRFIVVLSMAIPTTSIAQPGPFVPADFEVPTLLESQYFRIRMLTVNDVVKDYDAVMSSIEHLQGVFGPNSTWPSKDLTFEQDLIDLGWHQKEFQRRSSFAYTVVSPDEDRVLGCIYINPTSRGNFDASITLWVRADVVDDGYDSILYDTVKLWIAEEWPFENPGYPGRAIDWGDWLSL